MTAPVNFTVMNTSYAEQQFERNKNLKALGITLAVCLALLLLMFLVSWTAPQMPPPIVDNGIEINLGNSDAGLGTVAPQIPGEMSKEEANDIQPVKTSAAREEPEESKEVADNNDREAPEIHTSPKPKIQPKQPVELPKAKTKRKRTGSSCNTRTTKAKSHI